MADNRVMENEKVSEEVGASNSGETVTDWVGREVSVACLHKGETKSFSCTLAGADPLGIVALYEQEGCRMRRFLPWGSVVHVHLVDQETLRHRRKRGANKGPVGFSA